MLVPEPFFEAILTEAVSVSAVVNTLEVVSGSHIAKATILSAIVSISQWASR